VGTQAISEWARRLAARRKVKTRACVVCGTEFTTNGPRLYCSANCRKKAYRHRLKGRGPAGPIEAALTGEKRAATRRRPGEEA